MYLNPMRWRPMLRLQQLLGMQQRDRWSLHEVRGFQLHRRCWAMHSENECWQLMLWQCHLPERAVRGAGVLCGQRNLCRMLESERQLRIVPERVLPRGERIVSRAVPERRDLQC
jgi:hypothetical protein